MHTQIEAIVKELIFNEHESITDAAALQDARQSLKRMLEVRPSRLGDVWIRHCY